MYHRPPHRPNRSCAHRLGCLTGALAACILIFASAGVALAAAVYTVVPELVTSGDAPVARRLEALGNVVLAEIAEDPHLIPQHPTGVLPVCDDVPPGSGRALRLAFGLMRGTEEGRRLYALLVDHGICVGVTDLPFNSAYASARSFGDDWSASTIMVDRGYVVSLEADVLAAILVHEATHIDRAISGAACYYETRSLTGTSCTTLPNGVELEEEVAAHAAEAEWWIAAYGDDGKRFSWRGDYSENRLAKAYLRGPAAFRSYIAEMRSDPREGEGI